jgi:anti-sigma regulatory factor (Ser/Thr protein kinase)
LEERAHFPAELSSAGAARQFVDEVLRDWDAGDIADDAVLVVSELVVNAVLHARSPVDLLVRSDHGGVVFEVSDTSHLLPRRRDYDQLAITGRGLKILDALAPGWVAERTPTGKTIRARVLFSPEADLDHAGR